MFEFRLNFQPSLDPEDDFRLSKCQSLSIVLLRTPFTQTINFHRGMELLRSNYFLFYYNNCGKVEKQFSLRSDATVRLLCSVVCVCLLPPVGVIAKSSSDLLAPLAP